mmetsp:Transcript_3404/g.8445  ORF Transcript_3404/g.8445 Transcript_3404/m.8445 type:complete len:228 (-) Transcript_3404:165-848(-)
MDGLHLHRKEKAWSGVEWSGLLLTVVCLFDDVVRGDGGEEGGPAGARVELGGGVEQGQAPDRAHVHAVLLVVVRVTVHRLSSKRTLSARAHGDLPLEVGEALDGVVDLILRHGEVEAEGRGLLVLAVGPFSLLSEGGGQSLGPAAEPAPAHVAPRERGHHQGRRRQAKPLRHHAPPSHRPRGAAAALGRRARHRRAAPVAQHAAQAHASRAEHALLLWKHHLRRESN